MSTNYTPNYSLSQWEADDPVLRADFNEDNAKLDAALKLFADTLEIKGNCKIVETLHQGTGTYGADHPSKYTSTIGKPIAILMCGRQDGRFIVALNGCERTYSVGPTIEPVHVEFSFYRQDHKSYDVFTWYADSVEGQMNVSHQNYSLIALIRTT